MEQDDTVVDVKDVDSSQKLRLDGFHYQFYASCDVIPNVCLSDYAPHGIWHYPWCIMVAVGSRFNLPRMDHLLHLAFWKRHWLFYSVQWLAWIAIMTFALIPMEPISMWIPIGVMIFSWIWYYVVTWFILWKRLAFMAMFSERAHGLQFWEGFLWTTWAFTMIAYGLIGQVNFEETETQILHLNSQSMKDFKDFYDHPATIFVGFFLVFTGAIVKSYAIYLSGVNSFYYFDMMLNRPNARFVTSRLYKYFSSPTYHVGYVDGYGLALLSGWLRTGSPTLTMVYVLASHIGICVMNHLVEQKFVIKMYLSDAGPKSEI